MKLKQFLTGSSLVLAVGVMTPSWADWTRFRGPNGTGVAEDAGELPAQWSPTENLKWKIELPGSGVSCPIVVGDRVFVTSYSGYGLNAQDPGDMMKLVRHLTCIDHTTGKVLWQKDVPATVAEDPYSGPGVPQHGYASHTPTSDGTNVYAFFGKEGVYAYDMEGNELWHSSVGKGSDPHAWGSSSSPIVLEDVVIVTAGPESRAIVGLDKKTGERKWRVELEELGNVWGTPAVAQGNVVIGIPNYIRAFDPETGEETWNAEAMQGEQFSSSVVVDDQSIYAIEGRGGGSIALQVDAETKGDLDDKNVVWTGRDSSRFGSPVVHDGKVYSIANGIIACIDAKTGESIFRKRLTGEDAGPAPEAGGAGRPGGPGQGGQRPNFGGGQGGQRPNFGGGRGGRGGGGGRGGFGSIDYASPIIGDNKMFYVTRNGEAHVFQLDEELTKLAVNRVTADDEEFSATPAISDGTILMRSNKHLYCIGQ